MDDVVLVFGSRTWTDYQTAARVLVPLPGLLIEGAAEGADSIARFVVAYRGGRWRAFPAKWREHGRAAGPIRNQEMLVAGKPTRAIGLISGPVGSEWSRGSADMARRVLRAGLPLQVFRDGGVLENEWIPSPTT